MKRPENLAAARGQWTPSFIISTFGLGAFAVAILVAAAIFQRPELSLPAVFVALGGLVLSTRGILRWRAARWVRRTVENKRRDGFEAWPIRAESTTGRWVAVGVLEPGKAGVTLTVDRRATEIRWSELGPIAIERGGPLNGNHIVLEGPRPGGLQIELLQPNAVARENDVTAAACANVLERLRQAAVHAR